MKKSLYFKTVQEAELYFPNGVPSNAIAIVGDGSNVYISSDNANLTNQKYYNADLTNDEIMAQEVSAAEESGYNTGYSAGETAGYTAGETAGYNSGYSAGETAGYDTGYSAGEAAGYDQGYAEGEANGAGKLPTFYNEYTKVRFCVEIVGSAASNYTQNFFGDSFAFNNEFYIEQGLDPSLQNDWTGVVLEYSKDGTNWTSPEPYASIQFVPGVDDAKKFYAIPVEAGDVIMFRGCGANLNIGGVNYVDNETYDTSYHSMWFNAFGNVKSLMTTGDLEIIENDTIVEGTQNIDPDNYVDVRFMNSTLIDAEYLQLPLPSKYDANDGADIFPTNTYVYYSTFESSHYLQHAPVLPHIDGESYVTTNLGSTNNWFQAMFQDCYSLENLLIPAYRYDGEAETHVFVDAFNYVGIRNLVVCGLWGHDENEDADYVSTIEFIIKKKGIGTAQESLSGYLPNEDEPFIKFTTEQGLTFIENYVYIDFNEASLWDGYAYVQYNYFWSYLDLLGAYNEGNNNGYDTGYAEGEASGGGLTDAQIEQQSIGLFMTSRPTLIYNGGSFEINEAGYDSEYLKRILHNQMGLYVDKYNEDDGLYEMTGTNNVMENYVDDSSDETGGEGYISATFHAEAGDKVGFGFYGLTTDPETGDTIVDQDIKSQYSKLNYDSVNNTYKHFYDIATSGDYEARWQLSTDPETGDTVNEFTLEEVVQP